MKYKYIHFIGIGGISMSGLAELMLNSRIMVSGSDLESSHITEKLKLHGANIFIGHSSFNIKSQDLVVYSSAVKETNPEYKEALKKNIQMMERADFLGFLMTEYSKSIAISGTHGKTTTTGLISNVIITAKMDPTILIGGEIDSIHGNVKIGSKKIFITEACEYKRSFVKFFPSIGIILNIESDHLDYYNDIDDIKSAFSEFLDNINSEGAVIYNSDCVNTVEVLHKTQKKSLSFGIHIYSDIMARNIVYSPYPTFELYFNNKFLGIINLSIPGEHNIYNSLAAIAVSLFLNIQFEIIKKGIESFHGVKRRFENKGNYKGTLIIDDYAHHPTEIRETLKTAKKICTGKVISVFQPHTYTRTYSLLNEFSNSFSSADEIIILDIYPAREDDKGIIHSKDLAELMITKGLNCVYIDSFAKAVKYLKNIIAENDMVLTLGAGDVCKIGEILLDSINCE